MCKSLEQDRALMDGPDKEPTTTKTSTTTTSTTLPKTTTTTSATSTTTTFVPTTTSLATTTTTESQKSSLRFKIFQKHITFWARYTFGIGKILKKIAIKVFDYLLLYAIAFRWVIKAMRFDFKLSLLHHALRVNKPSRPELKDFTGASYKPTHFLMCVALQAANGAFFSDFWPLWTYRRQWRAQIQGCKALWATTCSALQAATFPALQAGA